MDSREAYILKQNHKRFLQKVEQRNISFQQRKKKKALLKGINLRKQKLARYTNPYKLNTSIPEEIKIDYTAIQKVVKALKYNKLVSEYYLLLNEDKDYIDKNLKNKADNIKNCCNYWRSDFYRLNKEKDIKMVNRCKDKFCLNCQKMLTNKRFDDIKPILDNLLKKGYYAYHIVLTQPNVKAEYVSNTIDKSFKGFGYLIRYLSVLKKIKGLDFVEYGYKGALRSLEITFGKTYDDYHLHLHNIIITNKLIDSTPLYENSFSFSKSNGYRKFSAFEILIQKIWYLLYNNKKVTLNAIDELVEGYSCTCDLITDDNFNEVFKYAIKLTDSVEDLTFDRFKTLYECLSNRRAFQGYGCLRGLKLNESDVDLDNDPDKAYNEHIAILNQIEQPIDDVESLKRIVTNTFLKKDITYISKSRFRKLGKD